MSDISREEKEKELSSLLHSGVVREKTQLHSLLMYLCAKAMDAPEEPLREHTIGVEALGKPPDYDPRIDASVRVEIAKLRKKIAEHYHDAPDHPLRIEIPKGAYLPRFVALPNGGDKPKPRMVGRWVLALGAIALIASVVTASILIHLDQQRLAPELEAFWAPHFNGVPTLIVYGAPLFIKMQGSFFRNPDINRPEEIDTNSGSQRVVKALNPRELRPVHTFTGAGEAEALFHITRVLASRRAPLRVERSDAVGFEDMKNRHIVFLGGRKFNLQVPDLPFNPKFEAVNRKILNLEPRPGEPAAYLTESVTPHGEIVKEYALISVLPGLTPGTRIVTLECSSTDGTLAAAEFLTRHDLMRELLSRGLPLKPDRGVFPAFQVVIGAKLNDGVVVDLSYKAHRILP